MRNSTVESDTAMSGYDSIRSVSIVRHTASQDICSRCRRFYPSARSLKRFDLLLKPGLFQHLLVHVAADVVLLHSDVLCWISSSGKIHSEAGEFSQAESSLTSLRFRPLPTFVIMGVCRSDDKRRVVLIWPSLHILVAGGARPVSAVACIRDRVGASHCVPVGIVLGSFAIVSTNKVCLNNLNTKS